MTCHSKFAVMEYGVCVWMMVPMRAEPFHKAEMVSQLIFGETYEVVEKAAGWLRIATADCGYEGWISDKQHAPLTEQEFETYGQQPHYRVPTLMGFVEEVEKGAVFPVPMGAQFPLPKDGGFSLAGHSYLVPQPDPSLNDWQNTRKSPEERLLLAAYQFLNTPYLWGGRTAGGIDCSGFVQIVFSCLDIQLPRDASQQVQLGETVDFIQESRAGDVAFFENDEGQIVHTGIIIGPEKIIHASGCVRIDTIDETGIYCHELHQYTHKLRIVKRLL